MTTIRCLVTMIAAAVAVPRGFGDAIAAASDAPIGGAPVEAGTVSRCLAATPLVTGVVQPLGLEWAPDDVDRMFIVQKIGRVSIFDTATGTLRPDTFLDLTDVVSTPRERGLLGLAFDPGHRVNGHVYASYNVLPAGDLRVSRFTVEPGDPDRAVRASEVVLYTVPQFILAHNGGQLRFGPDGMLWLSVGDGSTVSLNDADNNAQNPMLPHGKMLRFDVDAPPAYIPADNPFVGDPGTLDVIWALGLRNPWRFSFDRLTGDLYLSDVGRAALEEVNVEPAGFPGGRNYGWRCMEGTACTGFGGCTCFGAALTDPVIEVSHDAGAGTCCIIGGFVYRGRAVPDLHGRYFYADYCGDYVRSVRVQGDGAGGLEAVDPIDHTADLDPGGAFESIVSFGEDPDGELHLASLLGTIWRIEPGPCDAPGDVTGDGIVDVADLVAVILAWGPCTALPEPCPADLDGSGVVDVADLVAVILDWST